MQRNDSSINLCQKMKTDNYHLGQLNRSVSQIDIQCNMFDFVVEGHIYGYRIQFVGYGANSIAQSVVATWQCLITMM